MKNYSSGYIAVCILLFCFILLEATSLIICGACGYEQDGRSQACTHCGASVGVIAEERDVPADEDSDKTVGHKHDVQDVLMAALNQDISDGDAAWQAGDAAKAFFFWRNALGLARIAGRPAAEAAAALPDRIKRAARVRGEVERQCDSCEGTGKRFMDRVGLGGSVTRVEVHGFVCVSCSGLGYSMRPAKYSEMQRINANAQRDYELVQQGRLRRRSGNAWLPDGVLSELGPGKTALLRSSVAALCSRCKGVGKDDCRDCGGDGRIECTRRDCRDGWVEVSSGGQLTGQPHVNRRRCDLCRGSGELLCATCAGTGGNECSACGGSGERPNCRRCGGDGLNECSRCRGSGQSRDMPCQVCHEEGVVLCRGCRGDGRSR